MALLCFLLDLRNIPPPLLLHLKQVRVFSCPSPSPSPLRRGVGRHGVARLLQPCFLRRPRNPNGRRPRRPCVRAFLVQSLRHLANLYAAINSPPAAAAALPDCLALCYVHADSSSPPELKIAYRPGERFSLRDFHHAVNNLPLDSFLPAQHESVCPGDVPLTNLFSNGAIYSWATDDISKKVIAICMSAQNAEALRRSLMDAAEQCITVEFVMFEGQTAFLCDTVSEISNGFINRICDLENCVVRRYSPETQVFEGLVKRWSEELKDDKEETLQAVFVFRVPIVNSVNQISCNMYASTNQITDGFPCCQICRCHGYPLDFVTINKEKRSCPITSQHLADSDVTDTAVKIGEQTILFIPTLEGDSNLRQAANSISFDVIERTELNSLNEGVVMGTSHVVIPSTNDVEVALNDESSDQNTQIFYGLCETLFKLDQGLVCTSACNTETMKIGTLECYYLLQPSEKGPMLLRRLAGSEEILPLPDVSRTCKSTVTKQIKSSIETALSKILLKDYNPLQHERGFHSKLNCLVKDSLQFGSIVPAYTMKNPHHFDSFSEPQASTYQGPEENKLSNQTKEKSGAPDHSYHSFSEPQASSLLRAPKENKIANQSKEKASPSITEEWEKLVVIDDDFADGFSTIVTSRAATKPQNAKLPSPVRQMDEKTSKILERLEAPRTKKQRASKPSRCSTSTQPAPSYVASTQVTQVKKPLLPFEPSASQPLRPTFNRLRRKPIT